MDNQSKTQTRYLIIGPSWVGDMVMSQSLYKSLKAKNPEALIDVLAPAWCKPLLARMPEINRAIEMPFGHGQFNLIGRWKLAQELKKENYNQAFVLPNSAKSALVPFLAGIYQRTGFKGEMRYGLLTDLRPDKTVFQFMVERYVALSYPNDTMVQEVKLATCPHPKLTIDSANQTELLTRFNINKAMPLVGLCPGAEFGPAKRWPDEYYAEVAKILIEKGQQICLFGGEKDKTITAKIMAELPDDAKKHCFDLAGKTRLNDAVDLLGACHSVISNDSGLMHVAAAVGCKILAIYGSSSPKYTPPLSSKVQIIHTDIKCRPCFKRECPLKHLKCLKELPVTQVIDAFNRLNPSH